MATPRDFADFCCELLSSLGSVHAKRMFGGWGLSVDGLTVAIVTDLGDGDTLWLKADADTLARFEGAGCKRFSYPMRRRGETRIQTMNYYSAPEDAMDSAPAMAPWARLALQAAVAARAAKPPARPKVAVKRTSGRKA
ncbi:MAG: TfoX/Sxy family protein [Burkholderiaceae bacterium]